MTKKSKKVIRLGLLACIIATLVCVMSFVSKKPIAKAEGFNVSLASGTHEKWIDRLDLSTAQYAKDLYDWLIENSDNDGEDDALIDVSKDRYLIVKETINFSVDPSKGKVEDLV